MNNEAKLHERRRREATAAGVVSPGMRAHARWAEYEASQHAKDGLSFEYYLRAVPAPKQG